MAGGVVLGGEKADGLPTMGNPPKMSDVNPKWQGPPTSGEENPGAPGRPDVP